jgi:hypothetical protein
MKEDLARKLEAAGFDEAPQPKHVIEQPRLFKELDERRIDKDWESLTNEPIFDLTIDILHAYLLQRQSSKDIACLVVAGYNALKPKAIEYPFDLNIQIPCFDVLLDDDIVFVNRGTLRKPEFFGTTIINYGHLEKTHGLSGLILNFGSFQDSHSFYGTLLNFGSYGHILPASLETGPRQLPRGCIDFTKKPKASREELRVYKQLKSLLLPAKENYCVALPLLETLDDLVEPLHSNCWLL